MSTSTLVLILLGMIAVAYRFGRARSLAVVGGARAQRNLHSLPTYYGLLTALWCGLPALLLVGVWHLSQDTVISHLVVRDMPATAQALPKAQLGLLLNDVRNVVAGNIPAAKVSPVAASAA